MLERKEERRCKRCNSYQTYFRRITNERVCKVCGNVQKQDKEIIEEEKEW